MSWRREAPEPKLTKEEREAWQKPVRVNDGTGDRNVPLFDTKKCVHCGGVHLRACPRVRSVEFLPNGGVGRVEFWPQGQWSDDHILWPEDVWVDEDDAEVVDSTQTT